MNSDPFTVTLRVRGVVQGVGYRPFVYRIGNEWNVPGWVLNDAEGVLIEATGTAERLDAFVRALIEEAPFAAKVESVVELSRVPAPSVSHPPDAPLFQIRASGTGERPTTLISPDLPICPDCLNELFDETDRRYRYPFINCTHCGPRWSIIESLPYDRPRTTMKAFPLCPDCQAEYDNPMDRRFHAQPVACPTCGPHVRFTDASGIELARDQDAIAQGAEALRAGMIIAIKGLGGYHLACDARNEEAVRLLRDRKARRDKPFALMARDLAILDDTVQLSDAGRALISSTETPIVLAPRATDTLPSGLAPESRDLGVMLPYTPIQHLLFDAGAPPLLVMTSANRAGEPIAYQDDEALQRLGGANPMADRFLMGDRPIARRVDDSVTTILSGEPVVFRRARGYAPAPVAQHAQWQEPLLAVGAGLKNTVLLATEGYAFGSQHLGDLDDFDALLAFQEAVEDLLTMYDVHGSDVLIAHDLHPDYPSTRHAHALGGPTVGVQHHEAHIASVLAERGTWGERVLGFAFDGTGLGHDQTIWGGEILLGSVLEGFSRIGHLASVPLPGGDAAARTPAQAAVGFLQDCDPDLWKARLDDRRTWMAEQMIRSGMNTPLTSSMGRLFDTASALCGFEGTMSYEGQAAMALEALAWSSDPAPHFASDGLLDHDAARRTLALGYPLHWTGEVWAPESILQPMLEDLASGAQPTEVALRFHAGIARAVRTLTTQLGDGHTFSAVALSGGVWQNRLLHELAVRDLRDAGFDVWWNQAVPLGDGGIALGQAALAAAMRYAPKGTDGT